jgi:PqqD family protein of HPr-rel-A system
MGMTSSGSTPAGRGYVPRKRQDVLALDMGDGVILYDHEASLVHHLNPSASILWQLSDGDLDGAELAAEVAAAYGLDRDVVAAQVDGFIRELDALGLIEDASGAEEKGPASGGS